MNFVISAELQEIDQILRSPLLPPPQLSADTINNKPISSPNEAALMKSHEASKESYEASISSASDIINSGVNHKYNERNIPQQSKECNGNHINNGEPVIESINRTVIALVGSTVSLVARFCCSPRPKKVYWIHRHLAIMPQRKIGTYITSELIMVCIFPLLYCLLILNSTQPSTVL